MQATHEGPSPNQGGGPFALSPEAPPAEPTRLAAGWQRSAGEGPSRAGTMPSSSPIARASHVRKDVSLERRVGRVSRAVAVA